jgi:hypothetical protein
LRVCASAVHTPSFQRIYQQSEDASKYKKTGEYVEVIGNEASRRCNHSDCNALSVPHDHAKMQIQW